MTAPINSAQLGGSFDEFERQPAPGIQVNAGGGGAMVTVGHRSAATANAGTLAVVGGAGDDRLTLDYRNGDPVPAAPGGITFDGGTGNNVLALSNLAIDTATFTISGATATLAG